MVTTGPASEEKNSAGAPAYRVETMISKPATLLMLAFALTSSAWAQTEGREVMFSGAEWTLRGDVALETHLGREALRFRNGAASLKGVDFGDGTIEYDVATSGDRSFVGVAFRIQESRIDYENFYLRPHQTGRFDAMQYTPVRNGAAAWQLYPEYNVSHEIPRDSWFHVRLVVEGSRMEVFLGGGTEPAQVIEDLRLDRSHGEVSLLAYFPANQPEGFYPTAYSNVVIRAVERGEDTSPRTRPEADPEMIQAWSLSPSFEATELPVRKIPADVLSEPWTSAHVDEKGRLNLSEHRAFPEDAEVATVLARVALHSEHARSVPLDFGFSDRASIFLNGELLFSGNNTYRSRSLRYLGVMTIDNDTLILPLKRGENELLFAVSESFGGWGLTARLPDRAGLRITAP